MLRTAGTIPERNDDAAVENQAAHHHNDERDDSLPGVPQIRNPFSQVEAFLRLLRLIYIHLIYILTDLCDLQERTAETPRHPLGIARGRVGGILYV